ncbi:hypothetical protein EB001_18175 [bacterium]|jgi:hypothetical protein|nr:hypothetical protein [bacterium]
MKLSFFTIIFILLSSLCYAESSHKKYGFVGHGALKCYEFIDKSKDYYLRDLIIHAWAQGFMTAKNTYADLKLDLTSISNEEQIVIMKDFCEKNKRSFVADSVEYLMLELKEQQIKGDK